MSGLHAAAAEAGLQRRWEDANGRPHCVSDAVLKAILDRLDTAAPDTFLSAEAGAAFVVPGVSGTAELVLEDGSCTSLTLDAEGRAAGVDVVGYHRVIAGRRAFALAVAPPRGRQPARRGWGVGVQVPGLRDARPYGDLGTLAAAAKVFGAAGCSALAISPTHALFPADAARFSPYSPSTRLFHNVLLADPALIDAPPPPEAGGELIDWQAAIPARLRHLRAAYGEANEAILAAAAAFRHERGAALEAHARFDALHAALGGGGWPDWPARYHDPAGAAVQAFAAEHADDVAFYAFLQWLADHSLAHAHRAAAAMATGLITDLAVGMDRGGSHAWSRRDEVLSGLTIGAPPDPLGPEGQNWGITTLDPFALARTDFAPFIGTIRTALAHAGGIRIDHALGLQRLWVIPEGADASEGAYLTMPGDHLKRIVAIEARRAEAIVIAEDLGTVPPGFRDDLARRGMLGMRVLPFERDAAGFVPPRRWDSAALAMTGTHDTPTFAGWWAGRDLDWSRRLGRALPPAADAARAAERAALWQAIDGGGVPPATPPVDEVLAAVAQAPCALMIVPLEDLIGEAEQPNIPGTINEHPNWRRRMPADAATLLARPDVARRTALLTAERPG